MALIYKAEREAGLEGVLTSSSVAYHALLELAPVFELADRSRSRLRNLGRGRASQGDDAAFDLHYLKTVLATTCWNKNDDVFDPLETWVARKTPEDKPFNYEHDCSDIIGHVTSCWVVDDGGEVVLDETTADDLPQKFHVITGAVLYKFWQKPELQERMDQILAEIAEQKWFVSMECFFRGFDYALKSSAGQRVVARNEQTAFLTKYLRAYGGNGSYQGEKIGRVLRNVTFSGKGLVKRPANEESIIFAAVQDWNPENISDFFNVAGYTPATPIKGTQMPDEIKELADLKTKCAELEKALRDNDVQQVQAKVAELTGEKQSLESELSKASQKNTQLEEEVNSLKTQLDKLNADHAQATEELTKLQADQKHQARVQIVIEKLAVDKAEAEELAKQMRAVPDEAFAAQMELMAKTMARSPAQLPPQSTSKPLAPKSTEKPAPLRGEADDKGEATAEGTELEEVEVVPDPTGNVVEPDDGKFALQKQVAAFFGCEEDK